MKKTIAKHKGILFSASEFRRFIRLETCLFISGIGVSGFLLFSPAGYALVPLFLAVFFVTAAGYAYNHMTDTEEDRINNRRLNPFVTGGKGVRIVALMLGLGIFFSAFLPPLALLLFLLSIPLVIAYSRLRIKGILFAKNLYTGLTIGLAFLIGAAAAGPITPQALQFSLTAFFFGFTLNFLGDIRGYEGDLATGVRTLPVSIGPGAAKRLAHFMLLGFSVLVPVSGSIPFYPLAPFAFLVSFFLAFDRHLAARACLLSSFMLFPAILMILKMPGGGF